MVGGWLNTGDTYREDPDGYLIYDGRSDDMLKVGGIWCSPVEIENCLVGHPAVLEAAVVGHADADALIKPKAIVVLKQAGGGGAALTDELMALCKKTLAPYKYPRWVEYVPELPKTRPARSSASNCVHSSLPCADTAQGGRRCCCTRLFRLLWRQSDNRDEAGKRPMKCKLFGAATIAALAFGLQPVAAQTPIKIGFISTFSGPQAAIGEDMRRSVELAKEHLGGKMGGVPFEIVYEDDQFKPDVGKQKSEKLVQQDKVAVVAGYIWSNVLLASLKT